MVDVFISYSRSNQDVVARLAEAVQAEGYSVWWDAELPPHLSYGDVITEKIGAAKAAIVVWSQAAAASEWVRAEADVARGQKKLIQTSVDDRMPPMPFNQIQFASIGDWNGEADHPGWRKVKASLAALCGPSEAGAGPVPPPHATYRPPAAPAPAAAVATHRGGAGRLPWIVAAAALLLLAAAGALLLLRRDENKEVRATQSVNGAPPVVEQNVARSAEAPAIPPSRFTQAATIEDPDGYTNVRSAASARSAILARVEEGAVFTTFPQRGAWWQVRTADGTIGYMAASRIRTVQRDRPAGADPPQLLPQSSTAPLTAADLVGLTPAQLRIARNEIYARNGRDFSDPGLRRHFQRYSWYVPRSAEVRLNAVEQANVRLLQEAEAAKR